jgi:predicted dehydrogenase
MTKLRVAVVGVGALGRHHARILGELPGVALAAVADPHAGRGQAVAASCRTEWIADYRMLFDRVDAVSVVVPTSAHLEVASHFLQRGIPVLVEKPLAGRIRDAQALVRLADEHDALLQVGHVERFNPAWQAGAPFAANPKYIRAERTSPYTFRSTDIGVIFDLMIHEIDLLLSLVDSPVRRIEAFGIGVMGGGHEDAAQARITFDNGCVADLAASRICPAVNRSWQVWSAQGCVTIDLHRREVSRLTPSDALRSGVSPWDMARQPGADIEQLKKDVFGRFVKVEAIPVPEGDALTAELAEFVECVTHGRQPRVNGVQAAKAVALADEILSRVKTHSWDGRAGGAIGPYPVPRVSHRKAG